MTHQFTPGPWHITIDEDGEIVRDSKGNEICQVAFPIKKDLTYKESFLIQDANLALIAAAPDTHEALKDAIQTLDCHIAANPTGKTQLPELRARLAYIISKSQKCIQ